MRTRILFLFLILCPVSKSLATSNIILSSQSTVSLITCGPGSDVYSYFGHSALRVTDPTMNIDRVYNYGTFDFEEPHFYLKFVNGQLYYMLSVVRYQGFYPDYVEEKRFIKELPLNLSLETRDTLFKLLEINHLPQNKHYWYNFFSDNCATRIRDIVIKATNGTIQWPAEPTEHLTYRQLIMPYIGLNKWAKTGILLMLASGADKEASQQEYMFLPDHMHQLFAQAKLADGTPLCQPEKILNNPEYPKPIGTGIIHPYLIFSLLMLFSWFMVLYPKMPARATKSFFSFLFLASGALGFVFCYMWFFSAHQVCHANLNIAWAFPLNFFLAVTLWIPKIKNINRLYCKIALIPALLFLITFPIWKQSVPVEAILLCLTLIPGLLRFSGFRKRHKGSAAHTAH